MNPMDHDHAVDAELTEALHRLPHRPAPARLVGRVERVLAMAPAPRRPLWRHAWAPALAGALVLLVTAPVVFYQRTAATRAATATMVNEAIADHLRIAQAQRPLEIESGDGHRVRPWFEGRLDFSPVLPFVGDREVPLRGGALAWFLDRRAAAFVYGCACTPSRSSSSVPTACRGPARAGSARAPTTSTVTAGAASPS